MLVDDPDIETSLKLTEFQASVERCVGMLNGRLKHCGRSAHRHLRRAWTLRQSAPELAAFCMITAEEEAATAVILAVKSKLYSGSEKLNHKSHPHKLSLTPFLRAIHDALKHFDYAMPEILIQENQKQYKVILRFDANKLTGSTSETAKFIEPIPALNFVISDQNGPLNFIEKLTEVAELKGFQNILEYINNEANLRNKLLYAQEGGIAHVKLPTEFFERRVQRVTNLFILTLLITQSSEKQVFVTQCLDALLQIHKRIDATQFEFEPSVDGPLFRVERLGSADPIITYTERWAGILDFSCIWSPSWNVERFWIMALY